MADTLDGGVTRFRPSAEEHEALRDFWKAYDGSFEEIWEETRVSLKDDPELGKVMASSAWGADREDSRSLLGRAIQEDDWDAYFEGLRRQGEAYANAGLSFGAWFRVVAAIRVPLTRLLFEQIGDDPGRLRAAITATQRFQDAALAAIAQSYLHTKERIIARQQEAIIELSTPVLQTNEGVLLLPIVGVLDSHRAQRMTDQLLRSIGERRARMVVIDITGVPSVDSMVANHLVQTVEACRLLGAGVVLTGISAEVARTLVRLGVDLGRIETVADLQGGLKRARAAIGLELVPTEGGRSS